MMPIDIKSKHWFLTFPQCDLEPEQFNDSFWANTHISECIGFVISREQHADGGWHYHCAVYFEKTKRIRSLSAFDLVHNGRSFHGNYQPIRRIRENYDYITKDGDYFEDISAVDELNSRHEISYWELALQAKNKTDALSVIRRNNPREYTLRLRDLEYAYDKHFAVREELAGPAYSRASFTNVPEALDEWVWSNVTSEPGRKRSLFLIGPSRTGKTSWARSLGEHIYCMSQLVPSAIKNKPKDVEFIILDDIEQNTLDKSQLGSIWRTIVGCQQYLTINEKYKPQETINWNIASIWCLNKMLNFSDPDFVNINATIINITECLY